MKPVTITRGKRILFLGILGLGTLLATEAAARLYITFRGHELDQVRAIYNRRRDIRLAGAWHDRSNDHPYLPYHLKAKPPDYEMIGLRRKSPGVIKPSNVFRIFCLGGSTTYAGYPAKLEAALQSEFSARGLDLEVVNAADVSWTSAESLVDFAFRCVPLLPDAVIVYHGVNDVWPAFGSTWRPDYSHWRMRLVRNEPMVWDALPDFLDRSAAYVQIRSWAEGQSRVFTWKHAMMRYVPDFENDAYHGVEPYRMHMTHLIAVARAHRIPVLLATHVFHAGLAKPRYLHALQEVNEITRSLAADYEGVDLVDAAERIIGDDQIMDDLCHFRTDGDGEARLVAILGEGVLTHLADWLHERRCAADGLGMRTALRPVVSPSRPD